MLSAQPFEVTNFQGGLREDPTGEKNEYTQADNLWLTTDNMWFPRYGTRMFHLYPSKLVASTPVDALINFNVDTNLFGIVAGNLYVFNNGVDDTGAWSAALTGPTGNKAFIGNDGSGPDFYSTAEWKRNLLVATSHQYNQPVKIFYDTDAAAWKVITAGLPQMATPVNYSPSATLNSAITFINSVRAKLLLHFADISSGTHKVADTVSAAKITAPNATDLPTLLTLISQLNAAYTNHYSDSVGAGLYHYPYISPATTKTWGAPISSTQMTVTAVPTEIVSAVAMLNDLKVRANTHMGILSIHNFVNAPTFITDSAIYNLTAGPSSVLHRAYFYTMCNTIKAQYNAHLADGGTTVKPHSTAVDAVNNVTTADATTPDTLKQLIFDLRLGYGGKGFGSPIGHEADAQLSSLWLYHVAHETTNHDLPSGMAGATAGAPDYWGGVQADNWTACAAALNEMQTVFNAHMSDLGAHYTTNPASMYPGAYTNVAHLIAGLPITLASYNYAFVYKYSYNTLSDGDIQTFEMRGEPLFMSSPQSIAIEIENNTIANIPTLSNSTTTNYDTTRIQIEIYRTTNNGSTYYLVDTIANGTSIYQDTVTDVALQARSQTLYTEGGVLANELPPKAKFIHILEDFAYYANLSTNPNRILQSISAELDACPGSLFLDLPNEVKGISSYRGVRVAWTKTKTYRIEGNFDDTGQGSMSAIEISNQVGLAAVRSPVVTDNGIVFFGTDGVYVTDGYTLKRLNKLWLDSYQFMLGNSVESDNYGTYNRKYRRVWWDATWNPLGGATTVLDLSHPITDNCVFTTMTLSSSGVTGDFHMFTQYQEQMICASTNGYIVKSDYLYTEDWVANDVLTSQTEFNTAVVNYNFKSPAYDFGTLMVRKWAPSMSIKMLTLTGAQAVGGNATVQIQSVNDGGQSTLSLAMIRFRYTSGTTILEEKRKFPAGSLRMSTKQLIIFPGFCDLLRSDDVLTGTWHLAISGPYTGKYTLQINRPSALTSFSGGGEGGRPAVGNYVTTSYDGYTAQWLVTDQLVSGGVSITLVLQTPVGASIPPNGTYKWTVRGYPKDERPFIVGYCINYAMLGQSQQSSKGETGANA